MVTTTTSLKVTDATALVRAAFPESPLFVKMPAILTAASDLGRLTLGGAFIAQKHVA